MKIMMNTNEFLQNGIYNLNFKNMLEQAFDNQHQFKIEFYQKFDQFTSNICKNLAYLNFHYQNKIFKNKSSLYSTIMNLLPFLVGLILQSMVALISRNIITHQNIISTPIALLNQFYVIHIIIGTFICAKSILIIFSLIIIDSSNCFSAFANNVICQTTFISKLVFAVSSMLVSQNISLNLGIFIGSSVLITLQTVLMTNTINRKDISYITNLRSFLWLLILKIILILLSALFLNFQNKIFIILIVAVAFLYLCWYIMKGHHSFLNLNSKKILFLCTSSYISLISIVFLSLIDNKQTNLSSLGVEYLLSFFVIIFFLKSICHSQLKFQKQNLYSNLRNYQLRIFQDNEQFMSSKRQNAILQMGLLFIHEQRQCSNPNCYTKTKQLYNPQNYETYSVKEKSKSEQLRSRMLIKCFYELALREVDSQDKTAYNQILQNFYEFSYNQLSNEWATYKIYKMLHKRKLGFFQKIKIQTIFLLVSKKLQKFNNKLFQSKIQIQTIFQATKVFQQILNSIKKYLSGQIQVIQYLKKDKIAVQELKNEVKKVFKIIKQMDEKWKLLGDHLNMNKFWHFVHLIYRLFIKNERLTRSLLDNYNQRQDLNSISENTPFLFYQKQDPQRFKNEKIPYHFQSLCILAQQKQDKLLIKNISKTVEFLLGFSPDKLLGSLIEQLMPNQLQQKHNKKIKQWLQVGYITNENSYKVKFTKIKNNVGQQLDVMKYFKIYVNMYNDIEYVCLIKINSKALMKKYKNKIFSQKIKSPFKIIPEVEDSFESYYQNLKEDQQNQIRYSLNTSQNEKNIFLKNQRLLIKNQFKELGQKTFVSRIFLLLVALFLIITSSLTNSNLNNSIQYSSNYFDAMTAYRIPILLNTNYYKSILNVGVQSTVKGQIQILTKQFLDLAGSKSIRKTIYDKSFSESSTYLSSEDSLISQVSTIKNLNQIDLFYKMSLDILSLKSLPVNTSGEAFSNLNSYLVPSYTVMMNKTKLAFHNNFQNIFTDLKNGQQYMVVSFAIGMLAYLILVYVILNNFFKSLDCVMKAFIQIKVQYIDEIETYIMKIQERYQSFIEQGDLSKQKINTTKAKKTNKKATYLNSKSKQIDWSSYNKKTKCKYWLLFLLFILILFLVVILSKNQIVFHLDSLASFQKDQFKILVNFPSGPIVGVGMFEKYYINSKTNLTFNSQKYTESIESMRQFGNYALQTPEKEKTSQFYLKWQNYFFQNPCRYNPSVLIRVGINVTNCQTMLDHSFERGLNFFFRNSQIVGQKYLRGAIQLAPSQIGEIALAVNVSSSYVLDLLLTWSSEYSQRVNDVKNKIILMLILSLILILAFQLIGIQMIVLPSLKKQNYFVKELYKNFIPESLLIEQKIVAKQFEKNEVYQT